MSSYRLSVIYQGKRRSVETNAEEFDFFSLMVGGKKIRETGNQLELEGPVRVTAPGVANFDVATMGQLIFVQNLMNINALRIIELGDDIETVRLLTAFNAGEIARLEDRLTYLESNRPVEETVASGIGGQTVFTFPSLKWEFDNTVTDVLVFVDTFFQRIDTAGLQVESYRKLADNQIEFSETILEDMQVTARLSGPKFITPPSAEPFFRNDVSNLEVEEYPVGNSYDISTGKLKTYRDGLLLANSPIVGAPSERAVEKSKTTVELGLVTDLLSVMTFYHEDVAPTYRVSVSGFAGNILTVPTYAVGDGRLRVWRSGALMNFSGAGDLSTTYTESSTTTITFDVSVEEDEVITVEYAGVAPTWREDITGITTTALNFTPGNTYVIGDKKLQIAKNGVLMYELGTGLGDPLEIYQETGTGSVTLSVAAEATDVFEIYYIG